MVPDLHAEAAIIYDPKTNEILWEENSQALRSIASITKVMTATVFLENNPDLTQPVTIARSDVFHASTTHLRVERQSDGRRPAAPAADRVGQRRRAGARAHLDVRLGRLHRSHEREGVRARARKHQLRGSVRPAVRQRLVGVRPGAAHHARVQRRAHRVGHADARVHGPNRQRQTAHDHVPQHESSARARDVDVRAGKTGFISKSGYCLATLLQLPQGGPQVAVVVLGARSNAGRFLETRNLFDWMSTKTAAIFSAASSPASPVAAAPQAQIQ